MRKIIFVSLLFLCFFTTLLTQPVEAQRIAECDACGYCHGRPAPEDWNRCAQCIYTGINKDTQPTENKTLLINTNPGAANFNKPPVPEAGKYYTQLGCLNTGISTFRNASAAGGVLNFVLNNLIFPVVGTLGFAVIIYGAFLLATAQGDQFKIAQGKRLITSAIVGIIFTFSVVLIVNLIGSKILRIPGFEADQESGDLQKIKFAIEKLAADSGELPNHLSAANCTIYNPEIFLNSPKAGLIETDGYFPNWGKSTGGKPYLTLDDVKDPYGSHYYFDPDYRCRPDVKGCEGISWVYDSYDKYSDGKSRVVRAILSLGPDKKGNYCNPVEQYTCEDNGKKCNPRGGTTCRDASNVAYTCNNIKFTGCSRTDQDNTVLVLCGG